METLKNTNVVECPHCHQPVDVSDVLTKRIKDQYEADYNKKLLEVRRMHDSKLVEIKKLKEQVENEKNHLDEEIQKALTQKLKTEKSILEKKIRQQLETEKSDEILSYQQQLEEKINETRELNKIKAEMQKVQREKTELKGKLEAEMQASLNNELTVARKKIKEEIETKATMKLAEKELLIEQLREQIMIAQKKADQGSMQAQGEAQERMIEVYLKENFPQDEIVEIQKGAKGGDCLHIVRVAGNECGSVYFESKRAKSFQMEWLEKFKKDMRAKKATFGVIVTECYPKGIDRLCQKNGIWICCWDEFKSLCHVLRESVMLLHQVEVSKENVGGKMEMLYKYLTGAEFRGHIESIVEGFVQMNDDLAKERRSYEGHWKQREKQIQKVLINTSQLYSSIRGIAGSAIGIIKELELPNGKRQLTGKKED